MVSLCHFLVVQTLEVLCVAQVNQWRAKVTVVEDNEGEKALAGY